MLALRKQTSDSGFTLADVAPPNVGPSDVLIRVEKAGICGTDSHIFKWDPWAQRRIKLPLVAGHEFMGRVTEIGTAVQDLAVGDRVSAEGHISCGQCELCRTGNAHVCPKMEIIGIDRDGAFAEFVAVPRSNVWRLNPCVPDEIAAIFDPLGNAVHTVMAAEVSAKSVIVMGTGAIGLMAIAIARAVGAADIIAIDVNARRLDLARQLGADVTFLGTSQETIAEIRKRTSGIGADVLLEMSGNNDAIVNGLELLRNGGRAALLGIPSGETTLKLAELVILKGTTILGIHGRKLFETWYQTEALLRTGRIDLSPIISHVLPIIEFQRAFDLLESGAAAKIVLQVA